MTKLILAFSQFDETRLKKKAQIEQEEEGKVTEQKIK